MSKNSIQKIVIVFFANLIFLAFFFNQKSCCMNEKEDERKLAVSRAFHLLPDGIEERIFSLLDQWDFLKRTVLVSKSWRKSTENMWKIKPLYLRSNIGDDEVRALSSGNLRNLSSLYLNNNNIRGDGAKALSSGNLFNLSILDLAGNKIGDD